MTSMKAIDAGAEGALRAFLARLPAGLQVERALLGFVELLILIASGGHFRGDPVRKRLRSQPAYHQ